MRCIVIGAGIIGVTVALRLAQRGAMVTLLDQGAPGGGTTGTTFAWVNASSKQPRPYFELNAAGMAAHARLAAEFGDAPWLVPTGNLEWAAGPAEGQRLAARASRLRDWGYRVRQLTRGEVERLEPDLVLGPDVHDAAFYPDEGFIFPSLYLSCLLRAARERGVLLRFGEEVVAITMSGRRVGGVAVRSGTSLPADAVICCCGRWTPSVLRLVGAELPLVSPAEPGSPAVGLLVRTSAVVANVRRVLHPPGLAVRPAGGGHLLLHGDAQDRAVAVTTPVSPPPPAAVGLLEAVRPLVPYLQYSRVESATVGIRPLPVDGMSVAGWVPALDGLYVIVTHSGVTLAPILAELAAGEVHGSDEPALALFRPRRFTA